jgi:hypothetical protein
MEGEDGRLCVTFLCPGIGPIVGRVVVVVWQAVKKEQSLANAVVTAAIPLITIVTSVSVHVSIACCS